jgi:Mg2+-importing ATPase
VFLGASVRSGSARVLVVETGARTHFAAIAARIQAREPETPFAQGLRQFGYLLIRTMVVIVLFVLTVNLLLHRPMIESLLFAVALAVGLSPELLPAIVSITLAAGAREMSRQGVIVRRLEAIESLGSMDVLCTDKTGTLTEGTIVLEDATDARGATSAAVLRLAFLNASFETGIDNPIDAALVAAGAAAGLSTQGHAKVDEIPYDFQRRRLTIVTSETGDVARHLAVTKGAFSNVVEVCTTLVRDGAAAALTAEGKAALETFYRKRSEAGFRVLAVATRAIEAGQPFHRDDERDMTFVGFLLFLDPPKADATRTLRDLAALKIDVKVITGDNRHVTGHLARTLGLDPTSMLTGEALARLSDEALWHLAPKTALFAEIDPQQKERIVHALLRTGHSVGFGRRINVAPPARGRRDLRRRGRRRRAGSADIILLSATSTCCAAVEGGRRTFANTLKYIVITTSAKNMVSMALATPLLPFLPLGAKQIS